MENFRWDMSMPDTEKTIRLSLSTSSTCASVRIISSSVEQSKVDPKKEEEVLGNKRAKASCPRNEVMFLPLVAIEMKLPTEK